MARSQATAIRVLTVKSIGMISAWNSELPRAKPAPTIRAVGPLRRSTKPGIGSRSVGPTSGTRTRATGPSIASSSFSNDSTIRPSWWKMLVIAATAWRRGSFWQSRNTSLYGPAACNTTLTFRNSSLSALVVPSPSYNKLPSNAFTREIAFGASCLSLSNL